MKLAIHYASCDWRRCHSKGVKYETIISLIPRLVRLIRSFFRSFMKAHTFLLHRAIAFANIHRTKRKKAREIEFIVFMFVVHSSLPFSRRRLFLRTDVWHSYIVKIYCLHVCCTLLLFRLLMVITCNYQPVYNNVI